MEDFNLYADEQLDDDDLVPMPEPPFAPLLEPVANQVVPLQANQVSLLEKRMQDLEIATETATETEFYEGMNDEMDYISTIYLPERSVDTRFKFPTLFNLEETVMELCEWWINQDARADIHMTILFSEYFSVDELEAYRAGEMTIEFPMIDYIRNNALNKYFVKTEYPGFGLLPNCLYFLHFNSLERTHMMLFNRFCPNTFALMRIK